MTSEFGYGAARLHRGPVERLEWVRTRPMAAILLDGGWKKHWASILSSRDKK